MEYAHVQCTYVHVVLTFDVELATFYRKTWLTVQLMLNRFVSRAESTYAMKTNGNRRIES